MMKNKTSDKKTGSNPRKGKKIALGRGLESLIPVEKTLSEEGKDYFLCDIDLIRPNRYQPRRHFSETELKELSESIRQQGIIQPLLVRFRTNEGGYELIAGERRLRAAKLAGLQQVPVIVREADKGDLIELSIIENIQRENLNPIEEAEAYHHLIEEFHLTQEQVAARIGKSRPAIANLIRLRQLPDPVKESIIDGRISMGHARALLSAEGSARQLSAWRTVISKHLSVRETEALVKRLNTEKSAPKKQKSSAEDVLLADIADELARRFGTKVEIRRNGQRGKVLIDFYSNDDLDRLIDLLKKV